MSAAYRLPPRFGLLLRRRWNLDAERRELVQEIQRIDDQLKEALEEREHAVCGPFTVTWKPYCLVRVNQQLLRDKHPRIYAALREEQVVRRLRVTRGEVTE